MLHTAKEASNGDSEKRPQRFQQEDNWFSQAGKTFCTELVYKKNFSLDGQTRRENHPHSQSVCPVTNP